MTTRPIAGPPARRRPWLLGWVALAAVVFAARWWSRRGGGEASEGAGAWAARGGLSELAAAVEALGADRGPCGRAREAVARAQLAAEFGVDVEGADAALTAASQEPGTCVDLELAGALLALTRGEFEAARVPEAVSELGEPARAWLIGALAQAGRIPPAEALARVEATVAARPAAIAPRRAAIWLHVQLGDPGAALAALGRAREIGPEHLGLAVDEALLHASSRRELSGVADLTDQLLARGVGALGPRELARVSLARAVVHVHAGEPAAGLARLEEAWPRLGPWDVTARRLALELSLESGDAERARTLMTALQVREPERSIMEAWARLAEGDVMECLAALAECPQEDPRVAYLQGLALVEQRRWEEAEPWLARAERLMPGRVELEVARARVGVHRGAVATALRQLEGIAESELYAPRVLTGLGEAHLVAATDGKELRQAERALTRAAAREPRPAEALLLLAEVWQRRRLRAPEAERNVRAHLEQAAAAGLKLPRYREALARFLMDVGELGRAEALLRGLVQEPGLAPETPLRLVEAALERTDEPGPATLEEAEGWIGQAEALGAGADALTAARARLDLARGTHRSLTRASAELSALLQRRPGDVRARVLAARVLTAQRELEAAETLIRQGFYAEASGEPAEGRLFFAWGQVALTMHKRKQAALHARAGFHRMLTEQRPTVELTAAVEFAAGIFSRTEQHKLALGLTRELTEALPFHAEAWRLEARAQLDAGEVKKASRAIARALELDPASLRALELGATIAGRLGDREGAREAVRRALELAEASGRDVPRLRELLRRVAG